MALKARPSEVEGCRSHLVFFTAFGELELGLTNVYESTLGFFILGMRLLDLFDPHALTPRRLSHPTNRLRCVHHGFYASPRAGRIAGGIAVQIVYFFQPDSRLPPLLHA